MKKLSENVFVAEQIGEDDYDAIIASGIKSVINNRPDGEEVHQPKSADLSAKAKALGITFYEIPVAGQFSMDIIQKSREILETAEKPILLFCRTGTRSSLLWALSQVGTTPLFKAHKPNVVQALSIFSHFRLGSFL